MKVINQYKNLDTPTWIVGNSIYMRRFMGIFRGMLFARLGGDVQIHTGVIIGKGEVGVRKVDRGAVTYYINPTQEVKNGTQILLSKKFNLTRDKTAIRKIVQDITEGQPLAGVVRRERTRKPARERPSFIEKDGRFNLRKYADEQRDIEQVIEDNGLLERIPDDSWDL